MTLEPDRVATSNGNEFGGRIDQLETADEGLAWRITPTAEGRNHAYLRVANGHPVSAQKEYLVTYEMRAVAGNSGNAAGQAGAQITIGGFKESGRIEREVIERQSVSVVAEAWESFSFVWQPKKDYRTGELRMEFRPSYFREIIEIRDLQMAELSEGAVARASRSGYSYPGQDPNASWRAAAEARILEHRMAPLHIKVVDHWGKPVPDARIEVDMQRHAYLFGTCVKASRLTDAPIQSRDPDFDFQAYLADNVIYREKIRELFNFVVFENDMKWPMWAGLRSDRGWSQKVTMDAVAWLKDNNIPIKSHTMLWGSWRNVPAYLKEKENDTEALNRVIFNHIADQGDAFRDHIQYADVLNEAMSHNNLIEVVGWDQISEWFKAAREAMPGVKLVINEFDILGNGGSPKRQDSHFKLVEDLLADGAPVDVLGFQSHFWSTRLTPPDRMVEIMDRFASFGLPLMISEFDMNILDEELQADYTRDFLKVWFSHPATEAFLMWGFWAKAHWFGEPGAMYRADWSPKPNLSSYTDLVFGEWWTNETLTTDSAGTASVRAFKGDYEITVSAPGFYSSFRRPTLGSEGLETLIVLYPEDATD